MHATELATELAQYGPRAAPWQGNLDQALRYCQQFTARHAENFTVTSWLLPRQLQPHFHAVYAYCRWADDLADESLPEQAPELLDWWQRQLECCVAGTATHPVFVALAATIKQFDIPLQPFHDLLTAFRWDQNRKQYDTLNQLQEYCQYSANPVGRIVLHLFRQTSPKQLQWSDDICTGLQWVNFCQDVARDWHERGRIYLPVECWAEHGVTSASEFAATATSPTLQALICAETERAQMWLQAGRPLIETLPKEFGRNIDLIVRGGLAIAQKILDCDGEVLNTRPRVSAWNKLKLLGQTWWHWQGKSTSVSSDEAHTISEVAG